MPISWIDSDSLWRHLDGGTRVTIVNDAGEDIVVAITAVAAAFHAADGRVDIRRAADLGLDVGESFNLADDRPPPTAPIAAEAFLRLMAPAIGVIAEIYLRSDESRTEPAIAIEIGIVATASAPATGAVPIAEIDGLSAYIKLEP